MHPSRSSTNFTLFIVYLRSSCCTGAAWPPSPRFESTPFGPRPPSSSDLPPPSRGFYDGLATFDLSDLSPTVPDLRTFCPGLPPLLALARTTTNNCIYLHVSSSD